MYKEIKTNAIGKKLYSFKKGYYNLTLADKKEARKKLMKALEIQRETYFSFILNSGIKDITISRYESITEIFHSYGIYDVWEIQPIPE